MERDELRRKLLALRAGFDQSHAYLTRGYACNVLYVLAWDGYGAAVERFGENDVQGVMEIAATMIVGEAVADAEWAKFDTVS